MWDNLSDLNKVRLFKLYRRSNYDLMRDFIAGECFMSVEVLVTTMNQCDHLLIEKMNIKTDAIIGNQCDFDSIDRFQKNGHKYIYINCNERGVGQNRNNSLIRASADICLFADDDMVFYDGYEKIAEKTFIDIPEADVIIFNINEDKAERYRITKTSRVHWYNYLRYGMARVAIRLNSVRMNNIFFNQMFGGGCKYMHGEDNIFLNNCLKCGLKIYAVPYVLAKLKNDRPSTWNKGYDDKYLNDQGMLYYVLSKKWWRLLCMQDAIRRAKKHYKVSIVEAYKLMINSVIEHKKHQ